MQDFHKAQKQSIELLIRFKQHLQVGMNVQQGQQILQELNHSLGFLGWLTQPTLLFQSQKNSLLPARQILKEGTIVVVHVQPLTENAYASIGESFCFQQPERDIISNARDLTLATCTFANRFKCVGEFFVFAKSWCTNNRLSLGDEQRIGHQCFLRSTKPFLWPHSHRARTYLRRYQVQWYNPRRANGIYALYPSIIEGNTLACFGEMIAIIGDDKYILGREDIPSEL